MRTKNPLVSVVMNCYNGEKFLEKSLKSLKDQTYKNWELIFFDNNSEDRSLSIINSFKDKRFKIFKLKKLLYLYHARKLAVKKTKGKYVSFLDVDDLWSPNKLKYQVKFLQQNKNYKFCYSNYFIKKKLEIKKVKFKDNLNSGKITQNLLNNYTIGILTVLIERSLLINNKFKTKYNIIGDFDLFLRISLSKNIAYMKNPLATYRIHENNYTIKNLGKYVVELEDWLNTNKDILKKKGYSLLNQKIYLIKLKIKLLIQNFVGV
tara:strand:+ start:115 stop:903 length:789 start_codon:yes stop_codon:yes gene_type:complete